MGGTRQRRDSWSARRESCCGACGARIQSAEDPGSDRYLALGAVSRRGRGVRRPEKMVVLRSSLELHSHSAASATSSLDLSNEFLSLEHVGRRRLRSARAAEQSAVAAAAASVSTGLGRAPGAWPPGLFAARCPGGAWRRAVRSG